MKTKEEYDEHLLRFYADTFKDFIIKNGVSADRWDQNQPEKFANKALKEYGSAINNGIALELITDLKILNRTITDSIENFPTMFWKTAEGPEVLRHLARKTVQEKVNNLNEKIMKESLGPTDVRNAIFELTRDAKKIAFKDMKISVSMFEEFSENLKNCISYLKEITHENDVVMRRKLDENLSTIKTSLLNFYRQEIKNKENVEAFSYIQQFMHAQIHESSEDVKLVNPIKNSHRM